MSTRIARRLAVTALVMCMCTLAPHVAVAEEHTLEPQWSAAGPDAPSLLSADASGAAALGHTGDVVVVDSEGEELWRRSVDASTVGPVAIGGDVVVVVADDQLLLAFDRASGAERWRHQLARIDSVAVGAGAAGETLAALVTEEGGVELLDGGSGAVRWTVAVPVGEKMFGSRAWITDSRVMIMWQDEEARLRVFDVVTGAVSWGYGAPELFTMPAVTNGIVAFTEAIRLNARKTRVIGSMRGFAVADGRELWTRSTRSKSGFFTGVATAAGEGGIAMVDLEGKVTALDPQSGEVRWRRETGLLQFEAEPHVVGNVFVLPMYGTGLFAADVTDGEPIEIDAIRPGQTAMTIEATASAGNRLYLLVSFPWGDNEIWMLEPTST